jgi:CRISPR-associated protein Csd1
MSWIQKLHETYERNKGHESSGSKLLMPISHTLQQAHIEITIDTDGNFKSASIVEKIETLIPATEKSAGRTGKTPPPHPLCDKVQYCAADYSKYGGEKPSFFKEYEELLSTWCDSEFSHSKARAVLAYASKHKVVADLIKEKILHADADGKLLKRWPGESQSPAIFRLLTAKDGERDQGDAFIRWHVREANSPNTAVWEDESLHEAWTGFDASKKELKGLCMVTGDAQSSLALSHPKRIRHAGDGAKLISANDSSGYTFRGRFTDDTGQQACGVGYEVTQKAHNALRWLIQRQAYRNDEQFIVSWAVVGKPIPDPFQDSRSLFLSSEEITQSTVEDARTDVGDAGQAFARRLNKAISGYRARIEATEDIIVMGLDSATPGRMAITFYRELTGSEFLDRVEAWHENFAWPQNFGKESRFIGAPAPRDIAEAAFSTRIGEKGELRIDGKLLKSTVERLLPCIVDSRQIPRDLVTSVTRQACNRVGMKQWEWDKHLGIACSLFKGFFKERKYQMTLETDRTSRDYLYGRLLATAEHIESRALYVAGEKRDTTAAKLMQRFADRPASTWRIIELALNPYISRLRAKRAPFMHEMSKLLDGIICSFASNEFLDDSKLSGEFLLGYHCQRRVLNPPKLDQAGSDEESSNQ